MAFLIFSKFLKELIYKEIQKIWNYQLDEDTTLLSAYTLASQILPLNMNAQIFLVSEIRLFFSIFFSGNLGLKKSTKFCIPNFMRVLSETFSGFKSGLQISPEAHKIFGMTLLKWELKNKNSNLPAL